MADYSKLKPGCKLSETQYYVVNKVGNGQVFLKNDFGEDIVVDSTYAEKCLVSADQYKDEKTMSRTDITNLFLSSTNVALTVNYNK